MFDVLDKAAAASNGSAGIQAAQMIANAGIDAVITGSLGPNATDVLSAAGLKVYLGVAGTVRDGYARICIRRVYSDQLRIYFYSAYELMDRPPPVAAPRP